MCSFISDVKFAFMNVHLESTKVMFNISLLVVYNLSYTYLPIFYTNRTLAKKGLNNSENALTRLKRLVTNIL